MWNCGEFFSAIGIDFFYRWFLLILHIYLNNNMITITTLLSLCTIILVLHNLLFLQHRFNDWNFWKKSGHIQWNHQGYVCTGILGILKNQLKEMWIWHSLKYLFNMMFHPWKPIGENLWNAFIKADGFIFILGYCLCGTPV